MVTTPTFFSWGRPPEKSRTENPGTEVGPGRAGFIANPFTPQALADKVREWLGG
jgi:hypothetical protein